MEHSTKDFEITLKPDAKHFAIYTPNKVPLPHRHKVQNELTHMESLGIISKVDTPNPWCAGMAVAPKKENMCRSEAIKHKCSPKNTSTSRS